MSNSPVNKKKLHKPPLSGPIVKFKPKTYVRLSLCFILNFFLNFNFAVAQTTSVKADFAGVRIGDRLSVAIAKLKAGGYIYSPPEIVASSTVINGREFPYNFLMNATYQKSEEFRNSGYSKFATGAIEFIKHQKDGSYYTVDLHCFNRPEKQIKSFVDSTRVSSILAKIILPLTIQDYKLRSDEYLKFGLSRYPDATDVSNGYGTEPKAGVTLSVSREYAPMDYSDGLTICIFDDAYYEYYGNLIFTNLPNQPKPKENAYHPNF